MHNNESIPCFGMKCVCTCMNVFVYAYVLLHTVVLKVYTGRSGTMIDCILTAPVNNCPATLQELQQTDTTSAVALLYMLQSATMCTRSASIRIQCVGVQSLQIFLMHFHVRHRLSKSVSLLAIGLVHEAPAGGMRESRLAVWTAVW